MKPLQENIIVTVYIAMALEQKQIVLSFDQDITDQDLNCKH